jgi:hypothetical protein
MTRVSSGGACFDVTVAIVSLGYRTDLMLLGLQGSWLAALDLQEAVHGDGVDVLLSRTKTGLSAGAAGAQRALAGGPCLTWNRVNRVEGH